MLWRNLVSALVRRRAHRRFRRFEEACAEPAEVQRRVLLAKVARQADSDFGREHGFAHIDSVEEFRRRVPVCDYEYLRPYIDRVRQGEARALFGPEDRVLMFALTSGTTAEPKYIPITERFLQEYRAGWLIWGWALYRDHAEAFSGSMLNIVSRPDEEYTVSGVPCGAVSGLMAQMQPLVVRGFYALPSVVNCVLEAESKYYLILRLCLQRDVTFCCTPNPSTLVRLSELGAERAEELIRDLEQGGLSERCTVPGWVRDRLRPRLRPRPGRARRLAQVLEREGRLLPRHYWPNLKLIAVWKGGTVSLYLPRLAEAYGEVPTRDIGLIASEGRMSIPLSDEGSAGVLDLLHQFFEFIPEEEVDRPNPPTLLAHEVEVSQRYYLVMTTSGGCCRYNIMDHVEVVDRFHETPVIEFLNKGEHISSLTGEKLTEHQVVRALERLQERLGLRLNERVTLAPVWAEPPYYVLLVAENAVGDERLSELLSGLEQELRRANLEYAQKRKSGRLGPPRLRLVSAERFAAVLDRRQRHLRTPEQQKHVFLVPEVDYHKHFEAVRELECLTARATVEGGAKQ